MPTVIHSVNPYLEPTTLWIHDQIRSHIRYRPIVYARYVRNRERFPVERLVDFTRGNSIRRFCDQVVFRLKGTYPRYGDRARLDGADLIHAHFGQEGFRCLAAKRTAKIPLVTTFYGFDVSALPKIPVWKSRFKRLFAEGDLFLAEGPYMAANLCKIGCPESKVRVQTIGIDLDAFPYRAPSERDGNEILMYASLREKKGHRYGIDAFKKASELNPDLRLTIIGDGPLRPQLERQARDSGLEDRVTFMGNLPHDACIDVVGKANTLLYPSLTASDGDTEGGAPVGILEAMASGLPIVSTRHADIPFVMKDGDCGWLANERDVDGLAEGLQASLSDPEEAEKRAEAGREAVEARHTLESRARSLESHYDEVLR
jgi:colanic acid/amylovoran biosynthesis glycosyltransferase